VLPDPTTTLGCQAALLHVGAGLYFSNPNDKESRDPIDCVGDYADWEDGPNMPRAAKHGKGVGMSARLGLQQSSPKSSDVNEEEY
jgi:hypothetical protein